VTPQERGRSRSSAKPRSCFSHASAYFCGTGGDSGIGGTGGDSSGSGGSPPIGCDEIQTVDVAASQTISGTLESERSNCYQFTVANNGTLSITLGEVSVPNVHLLVAEKPDGDTLTDADTIAGDGNWYAWPGSPLEVSVPLAPGTYLIKVHNGNATYNLILSFAVD